MHLGSVLQVEWTRNYAVRLDSSKYRLCNGQEEGNQEVLAEETDSILMFSPEMKCEEEHKKQSSGNHAKEVIAVTSSIYIYSKLRWGLNEN